MTTPTAQVGLAGTEKSVRRWPAVLRRPLSARGAAVSLVGMAAISILIRLHFVSEIPGPFIFLDELAYVKMAENIARTGQIGILGKTGLSYSPGYSLAIAPIYALIHSAPRAYSWVKAENVVLMSLSVFPLYAIARRVLSRGLAVCAAALSLFAPLMFYTDLTMSENLAYPLFLVAIWAMLRALEAPSWWNDLLLLGMIFLASLARLQQAALIPAALTAIFAVPLIRPDGRRVRALVQALRSHWLLVGTTSLFVLAVLARSIANGGSLPGAGRYSNVGTVRPGSFSVLERTIQQLAGLDLAVAVVPFAAAIACAYALHRRGYPRKALLFGAVAAAVTFWVVLLVGYDAAGFENYGPTASSVNRGRIDERYMIYLSPFFLIALVAALRLRREISVRVYAGAALLAAVFLAAIPFHTVISNSIVGDTFSLAYFARDVHGTFLPIHHAALKAIVIGGTLAASLVLAAWRAWTWPLAIAATLAAFIVTSNLMHTRIFLAANGAVAGGLPSDRNWVDKVVGEQDNDVVVVAGKPVGNQFLGMWETIDYNLSIGRVFHVCGPVVGPDFGDRYASPDRVSGSLEDVEGGTGTILAPYAVVPSYFNLVGRVLAVDSASQLVLIQPRDETLTIPAKRRRRLCN